MVQAVVRSEPGLRDCALALVDGASSIRTVTGLNDAAAKVGIELGMTKPQVQQFGEIEVRERSRTQERIAHAALLDLGWSVSPRIEDTAADTVVLDLAGLASLFGAEENIAGQLAEGTTRLGFITQIATASNLDAAILVSRAFAGITVIPGGEESTIIGKVPVSALSPSAEVLETLEHWGVHTCAALAALPVFGLPPQAKTIYVATFGNHTRFTGLNDEFMRYMKDEIANHKRLTVVDSPDGADLVLSGEVLYNQAIPGAHQSGRRTDRLRGIVERQRDAH